MESAGRAIGYDYLLFWSALGGLLSLQGAYQGFSAHAEPSKQQQLSEPSSRVGSSAGSELLHRLYEIINSALIFTSQDDKLAAYQRFKHRSGLPKEIVLYQYQVCPFCNKVRAFLDYHNVRLATPFVYSSSNIVPHLLYMQSGLLPTAGPIQSSRSESSHKVAAKMVRVQEGPSSALG